VPVADEPAPANEPGAVPLVLADEPLGLAEEVERALARVLRPVGAWRAEGPGTGS